MSSSCSQSRGCDPCCGVVTLQSGTKIVAILDVIICITVTVFGVTFFIHDLSPVGKLLIKESRDFQNTVEYVLINGIIVVGVLGSIFGVILYKGAQEESEGKVHTCLVFRYFLLLWDMILFIRELVDAGRLQAILVMTELTFELYTLLVVYAYVEQLKGRQMRHLC